MPQRKSIKEYIRTVQDFPKPGIMFRDVTSLFSDANGFRMMLDQILDKTKPAHFDVIAGIDARGFIIGGALADRMG